MYKWTPTHIYMYAHMAPAWHSHQIYVEPKHQDTRHTHTYMRTYTCKHTHTYQIVSVKPQLFETPQARKIYQAAHRAF